MYGGLPFHIHSVIKAGLYMFFYGSRCHCDKFRSLIFMTDNTRVMCVYPASQFANCTSTILVKGRKERNVIFNDALNPIYLRLYGVRHMVKDHSDSEREETHCRHVSYSFQLTARVVLYASSHRQNNTYHGLCYTSRERKPAAAAWATLCLTSNENLLMS